MEKEIPISQKMELGSLKDLLRLVVSIMGRSNQSGYLYYGEKDGKHVYFLTHTVGGWYELRGLPVTLIAFTEIQPETNFLEYSPPSNENEESYKFINEIKQTTNSIPIPIIRLKELPNFMID